MIRSTAARAFLACTLLGAGEDCANALERALAPSNGQGQVSEVRSEIVFRLCEADPAFRSTGVNILRLEASNRGGRLGLFCVRRERNVVVFLEAHGVISGDDSLVTTPCEELIALRPGEITILEEPFLLPPGVSGQVWVRLHFVTEYAIEPFFGVKETLRWASERREYQVTDD